MKRIGCLLLGLMSLGESIFAQKLTADGGCAWVRILPRRLVTDQVIDDNPVVIEEMTVQKTGQFFAITYKLALDNSANLKRVSLWVKKENDIWRYSGQELYNSQGLFYFHPGSFNFNSPTTASEYTFALQAENKNGSRSPFTTPPITKPRGWFFYPDQNNQMRVVLEIPPQSDISEFLIPGINWSSTTLPTQVGIGGSNGWGFDSLDIFDFVSWPVSNLYTNFNEEEIFRGTPFIITSDNQLAYFNLGSADNPLWDFKFGANSHLIVEDGAGESIIEFQLADYIAPTPKIVFDSYKKISGRKSTTKQPYLIIDAATREMTNLFSGLSDQSEISQITVIYYFDNPTKMISEKPVDFYGWPVYLELTPDSTPISGLTLAAIDINGDYHYLNTDVWQMFFQDELITESDGIWQLPLP